MPLPEGNKARGVLADVGLGQRGVRRSRAPPDLPQHASEDEAVQRERQVPVPEAQEPEWIEDGGLALRVVTPLYARV